MSCNIKPAAKQEVEKHFGEDKTGRHQRRRQSRVEKQVPMVTTKHTAALNHRDNHLART